MWTFVVEDVYKVIEPSLLLKKIGGGKLDGFFLQGEMHSFVAAILLGMARADAFNADAQSDQTSSLLKWNKATLP